MKAQTAKHHLKQILKHYTPGSVLHLLAEVIVSADTDPSRAEQVQAVEQALYVFGLGLDAALPEP